MNQRAQFIGWQDFGDGQRFALFNLLVDIPGHPEGSTVTARTLNPVQWARQAVKDTLRGMEG